MLDCDADSKSLSPPTNSQHIKKAKTTTTEENSLFIDEALFLSRVKHPHIVSFIDCGLDQDRKSFLQLQRLIKRLDGPPGSSIPQEALANSLVSCLNVIDLLASLNLLHGDLKPEHFMLNDKGKFNLIDFAQVFSLSKKVIIGTSAYLAPELFWNYGYTLQSDLFSLGMSLLRMGYTNETVDVLFSKYETSLKPWTNADLNELRSSIRSTEPVVISILRMITFSPLSRPTSGREIARVLIEEGVSNWSLEEYDSIIADAHRSYVTSMHWVYRNNPLLRNNQCKTIAIKYCHEQCVTSFCKNYQILSKLQMRPKPGHEFKLSRSSGVSVCKEKYFIKNLPRLLPAVVRVPGSFDVAGLQSKLSHITDSSDKVPLSTNTVGKFKRDVEINDVARNVEVGISDVRNCSISRHFQQGLSLTNSLLENSSLEEKQRLISLSYKAYFLGVLGFPKEAVLLLGELTKAENQLATLDGCGEYFSNCGGCYFLLGKTKEAISFLSTSEKLFNSTAIDNDICQAMLYSRMASAKWLTSGPPEALALNSRAFHFAEKTKSIELKFSILLNRCMYLGDSGKLSEEMEVFSKVSTFVGDVTSKPLQIHYLHNLAASKLRSGDYDRALLFVQKADWLCGESGLSEYERAHLRSLSGNIYHGIGNLQKATTEWKLGSRAFRQSNNIYNSAKCFQNLAEVNFATGRPKKASRYLHMARQLFNRAGYKPGLCDLSLLQIWYSNLEESDLVKINEVKAECEVLNYVWGEYQALWLIAISHLSQKRLEDFSKVLAAMKACSNTLNSLAVYEDITYLENSRELTKSIDASNQSAIAPQDMLRLFRRRATLSYRENRIELLDVLAANSRTIFDKDKLARRITKEISEEGKVMSIDKNNKNGKQTGNAKDPDLIERFRVISEIAALVDQSKNVDEYVSKVLELTVTALSATRGAIFLVSKFSENVEILGTFGCNNNELTDIENVSRSLLREALEGNSIFIRNTATERNYDNLQSLKSKDIKSAICIPLKRENEVFGAVYVDTLHFATLFEDLDKTFLDTFGSIIAGGVSTSYRLQKLNADYQNALRAENDSGLKCSEGFFLPSSEMQEIYRKIFKVAPLTFPVLILGQTGSGKEVLAKMIHENSHGDKSRFVAINCSAIPPEHLESELFGVADRAFTNVSERCGKLELADGGTLFLDEIAEMPLNLQAKLLRAIERMEFEPLGGSGKTKTVKFRLLTATNQNIRQLVSVGKFREDLYHRINDVVIQIPDLAKRPRDIQVLIQHYFNYFQGKLNVQCSPLSDKVVMALMEHDWPGGIRELSKVVSRLVAFSDDPDATIDDLPSQVRQVILEAHPNSGVLHFGGNVYDKEALLTLLRRNEYSIRQTANEMRIAESTLRYNLKKLNIEPTPKRFRA